MAEKKTATWKLALGYSAFTFFALIIALLLTFPYDTLKDRIRAEAASHGYFVRIGSMGPGFFSIRAKNVELSKPAEGDAPAEALTIDSISAGPTLFPPGLGVSAKLLGGSASVRVSGLSTARVRIDADDLDLTKGNVKGFSGVDLAGSIDAHVDLSVPKGGPDYDMSQATGTLTLDTQNLAVNGGKLTLAIPMFGPEPTPLDLPKIVLGDIGAKLKFDKGAGTVDDFHQKSADLEANITGTLKLAKRIDYCEPAMELRFKPDPEFQKRLGMIGSALSMVGADPKDPAWRLAKVSGFLGKPQVH